MVIISMKRSPCQTSVHRLIVLHLNIISVTTEHHHRHHYYHHHHHHFYHRDGTVLTGKLLTPKQKQKISTVKDESLVWFIIPLNQSNVLTSLSHIFEPDQCHIFYF